MPYTSHGHWFGPGEPAEPRPQLVARCGGPALCSECWDEAKNLVAICAFCGQPWSLFHVCAEV